jgi:hypothetical protein
VAEASDVRWKESLSKVAPMIGKLISYSNFFGVCLPVFCEMEIERSFVRTDEDLITVDHLKIEINVLIIEVFQVCQF